MKKMKKLFEGVLFGIGVLFVFSVVGLVFAGGYHIADEVLSGTFSGDYDYTGSVNFSAATVDGISSGSIPSGFIGAFYLTSCPSGWTQADGNGGRPDLRGQFLRGLNTFDGGTTTRADGNQDPDGGARVLGDYQADEFDSHTHQSITRGNTANANSGYAMSAYTLSATTNTGSAGGSETRGKNVAVIFCVKD